jgi:CrcB protein
MPVRTRPPRAGADVCYEHPVHLPETSRPFGTGVLVAIAVGGAIGASARWATAWLFDTADPISPTTAWPWATLVVNVVGCALIGLAARLLVRHTVGWAFAVTGVLGGFTTFSALAVELNDLAEADRLPLAVAYGAVTLAAGIGATFLVPQPVEVGE